VPSLLLWLMERVREELKAFGFSLTEEYQGEFPSHTSSSSHENSESNQKAPPKNFNSLKEQLLYTDFKAIKSSLLPYLTQEMNSAHTRVLNGPIVLQISSLINLSQSSKRQHDGGADSFPRLIQVKVTDGHMTATGIEFEQIPEFNKIVPGMKLLLLDGTRIFCGKILLTPRCCRVLGGRVDHLYSAWATNRHTLTQRKKNRHESGGDNKIPPKFELQINGKKAAYHSVPSSTSATGAESQLSELSISSAPASSRHGSSKQHSGSGGGRGGRSHGGGRGKSEDRASAKQHTPHSNSSASEDRRHRSTAPARGGGHNGGGGRGPNAAESDGPGHRGRGDGGRGGRGSDRDHSREHRPHSAASHSKPQRGRGGEGRGRGRGRGRGGGRDSDSSRADQGPTSSFNLMDAAWPGL
jgi:hypothetical protein